MEPRVQSRESEPPWECRDRLLLSRAGVGQATESSLGDYTPGSHSPGKCRSPLAATRNMVSGENIFKHINDF